MTPERDGSTGKTPVVVFGPISISADNTPAAIDLRDFGKATLILGIGVGGITFDATNKIEFKLTHSDDDSTYVAVTNDDVIKDSLAPADVGASGIIRSLVAAHAAATVQKLGYIGGKRYIKLLADFSGTHGAATPLVAHVVKEKAEFRGAA